MRRTSRSRTDQITLPGGAADPLASSPIFAALIHAASRAKDQGTSQSAAESPPEDFDLDPNSEEEETATYEPPRRKRSANLSPPSDVTHLKRSRGDVSAFHKGGEEHGSAMACASNTSGGSKGGSSCHQCKSRRLFEDLTYCTSSLDQNKKKTCRKKYCNHCLNKFYDEPHVPPKNKLTWICPSCRRICCCAACRRKELKQGTSGFAGCRKPGRRESRAVPMDYDAVLDLEELRLMAIQNEMSGHPNNNSNKLTALTTSSAPSSLCESKAAGLTMLSPAQTSASTKTTSPDLSVKLEDERNVSASEIDQRLPAFGGGGAADRRATVHDYDEVPPLRLTVAYMLAITQFASVKEMLRRVTARNGIGAHEKAQLISVLLRRIHQKYAAKAQQRVQ